jgi:hypothetical protein
MGCLPYFTATGMHPLLPLDIVEATYLLPPPTSMISTIELIVHRVIALQKHHSHLAALCDRVMKSRVKAARQFEKDHLATIHNFNFQQGDLVLVHNTIIEKALNHKMQPQYVIS